jgi:zinc protease
MKRISAALAILLFSATLFGADKKTAAAKGTIGSEILTKTLKNGMKVIVWPDHDIPNVALYNWFKVGSRNERPGITGLSHFFEHMMFNGAKKYGPGEFDRVMEANGGSNNAYTSENVTVYQDWFPRSAMELIFDLEGDRLANLAFDPKIIESERGVVYSERRSAIDNDNNGLLNEQVQATAYLAHPYQFPVIGWPSDIESWSHEDLVSYFKTYYAPNNATMIVVGDVKPEEVFALAEKYIGPIPSQPAPEPVKTKEPEQQGERRVTIARPGAQVPLIQMAYHIGKADDPSSEVLQLLTAAVAGGESSRLYRRLVDQERLAIDISSYQQSGFDPSLLWVFASLSPRADVARAEAIITEELQKVATGGITDEELRKAKNIRTAGFWRSMRTINGKAQALGTYEVFHGDYRKLFDTPQRIEKISKEEIQKVAAEVFRNNNRTVGLLLPAPAESTEGASR